MDIDAAVRGDGQHILGENLPVRRDDHQIGLERPHGGNAFRRVDAFRLKNRHIVRLRDRLHAGTGLARGAALLTDGAVRLRHQADNLVATGQQCLKRGLGEAAGAHHDDSHSYIGSKSPFLSRFSISASGGISPRS